MIASIHGAPRFGVAQEGEVFRVAEIVTSTGLYITWPESFSHPHAAIRLLLEKIELGQVKATHEESEAVRLSIQMAPRQVQPNCVWGFEKH